MSTPYWTTTVTTIGPDAQDLIDGGVIILFGDRVPPALAEVSVLHSPAADPERNLAAGDVLTIGEQEYPIDLVGEQAAANLRELGHIVLYVDAVDQQLLPGAVHVTGQVVTPTAGETITLRGA